MKRIAPLGKVEAESWKHEDSQIVGFRSVEDGDRVIKKIDELIEVVNQLIQEDRG